MFKNKVTTTIMLVAVIGGSLFLCVSENLQGRTEWTDWLYPTIIGIAGLVFVLINRRRK